MFKKALLSAIAIGAMLAGSMARAENLETFRIGLIGGENEADRLRNYQCVVDQLPKVLGVKEVKLFPATDYDGVIQGLLGGTLDAAELGASGYAKIYLTNPKAVEPILTDVQTDGSTGYYSIMIARKDSGIKTLADMKGKKLGFADPDSTSGYLIPVTSLPKDINASVKDYFGETGFGGGHENLVLAVKDGKFDAGTTFGSGVGKFEEGYSSGNLRKMVDKGLIDMKDFVELWKSPLIPNGPTVVRSSMNKDTIAKYKEYLMNLPKTDPACFAAASSTGGDRKGYTEVNAQFYQPIIDARKAQIGG
ncbi:phosphonate ABC transporter substrate-binding protein [Phyllobacterium sp. BT25]|uniref:Phosphonate ABC transporter substrate-binding protein n=1 Tax=Phyllobacterium pellucidum TaxID=2740464 RepID=A0A849VTX1_9HYPH|nr:MULTISPECIES: phosphonate ABC transporter substrate-binding protein [Phyllobacterium]NTS31597.1 phosphonate ABC transporter substrate-binding protein [Phyllobacterium pellucidum]UGY09060.1 phosphonate ABC transporter substrate-binding protein [Phyllobacterium sp. T1018]SFI99028.1 phosphonate transport system substrate-binding protein [Phyllobacterium sp. CL33Tsu]